MGEYKKTLPDLTTPSKSLRQLAEDLQGAAQASSRPPPKEEATNTQSSLSENFFNKSESLKEVIKEMQLMW